MVAKNGNARRRFRPQVFAGVVLLSCLGAYALYTGATDIAGVCGGGIVACIMKLAEKE